MKAVILSVSKPRKSRHGDQYHRVIFKSLDDGLKYIFDCYPKHVWSARFLPFLKPQAIFEGLSTIEHHGKQVINGMGQFNYKGQAQGGRPTKEQAMAKLVEIDEAQNMPPKWEDELT